MKDIHQTITRVRKYANRAGIDPETVARKATGNPRLLSRMERRAEQLRDDIARLEKFMLDNPLGVDRRAKRHVTPHGSGDNPVQGVKG